MIDLINILLALTSIGLGAIGWINPAYVMDMLGTEAKNGTMGLSEVRAASGAMFVGLGVGALLIGTPTAYAMMGIGWGFAALGRATSLALDGQSRTKWIFFLVEAGFAALALALNL